MGNPTERAPGRGDAAGETGGAVPDESVHITILLSGTPTPTPERWGSAILVSTSRGAILLDAGPGVTRRLVQAGISPTHVDTLVFTHHHFDHNAGFPGFFLSRWDQSAGRHPELSVYGPPPTTQFLERLFSPDRGAFWPDLNARIESPGSQNVYANRGGTLPRERPDPRVRDIAANESFSAGPFDVTTSHAVHVQPYLDSLAYRVDVGGMSIVYTGDTEPCDEVIGLAQGCDVLLSMCWDAQHRMVETGESAGQTGTVGAAKMASEAGAGALLLTHTGPNLGDELPRSERERIKDVYDGPTYMVGELWEFAVKDSAISRVDEQYALAEG